MSSLERDVVRGTEHAHDWGNYSGEPLHCEDCGELWPGEPLPVPAHHMDGYGDLADLLPWHTRVDRMVGELARDAA